MKDLLDKFNKIAQGLTVSQENGELGTPSVFTMYRFSVFQMVLLERWLDKTQIVVIRYTNGQCPNRTLLGRLKRRQ